jgi:hypothetical protein
LILLCFSLYNGSFERSSGALPALGRKPVKRITIVATSWLACALVAFAAQAGITGVCPDGSIYIVPRAELIPCRDSRQVAPEDVPPVRPENLPRPYGWEVFNRRNDPNNPYNLVDTGRAVRGEEPASGENRARVAPSDPRQQPQRQGAAGQHARSANPLPAVSSAPPAGARSQPLDIGLGPGERRDLALIVEYSQRRAPAMLARAGGADSSELVVRLAQSASFEARLRDAALRAGQAIGGPVLLFTAGGGDGGAFHGNLTFVQGHMAFHPDASRSGEFGLLAGRLGTLAAGEALLGYVVLPEHMDLSQPMDIYWDDRQVTATLRP